MDLMEQNVFDDISETKFGIQAFCKACIELVLGKDLLTIEEAFYRVCDEGKYTRAKEIEMLLIVSDTQDRGLEKNSENIVKKMTMGEWDSITFYSLMMCLEFQHTPYLKYLKKAISKRKILVSERKQASEKRYFDIEADALKKKEIKDYLEEAYGARSGEVMLRVLTSGNRTVNEDKIHDSNEDIEDIGEIELGNFSEKG